eukprot:TRINITY_DN766_c0_g1_i2.p1 TRINITY_DN766_c0_g1~~TRINITY_DN766_c0_g1_i2.p1  ORF type:complete len:324 (-),score=57.97 TRINITY_DN766_c0_g1_i2:27-998(-)
MSVASTSKAAARFIARSMRPFNSRVADTLHAKDPLPPVDRLRVASYNVLAQAYSCPEYFQAFQRPFVKWKHRGPIIFEEISHYRPDLLCLQECDFFDTCWRGKMAELGYGALYAKRGGTKKDGCAIFYLRDRFAIDSHSSLDYNEVAAEHPGPQHEDYIRNNVALVAHVRRTSDNMTFILACTHLFWDPQKEYVKIGQALYLKKALVSLKQEKNCGVIVCGDFNSMPDSKVYNEMIGQHAEAELTLESAYSKYREEGEPEFTNYDESFSGTLDYVFFSSEFQCASVLDLPSMEDAHKYGPMPNSRMPSDHVMLVAELVNRQPN